MYVAPLLGVPECLLVMRLWLVSWVVRRTHGAGLRLREKKLSLSLLSMLLFFL